MIIKIFELIFPTLVNLQLNSGSFVPKLEVNLKINLGTFKLTTSMFIYGQNSRIWIIEIDHRSSLFLIQIFIRSWQNKTWRELLFTVMIALKMKRIFREVTKIKWFIFFSSFINRSGSSTGAEIDGNVPDRPSRWGNNVEKTTGTPGTVRYSVICGIPTLKPTMSANQMTLFFCRKCLFFGLNQCRNSCNLFCSVIPTSV